MAGANQNRTWVLPLLGVLAVALFALDVMLGSVKIPFNEVFRIVFSGESENRAWLLIVEKIRLPKATTAILAGCGLSVSGLQMQTLFRNPLAGPSELGITAGAGLGVASVMLVGGSSASPAAIASPAAAPSMSQGRAPQRLPLPTPPEPIARKLIR